MIGPKHFLLSGLALAAFAGTAVAADVPTRPIYTKAPPPVSYFEGVYIGVHGGYAWGDADVVTGPLVGNGSPDGGFGGFQFGYNYRIAPRWVLGYEVDVSFGDISDATPPIALSSFSMDVFGTARARLGYTQGPWMVYATGGLAWTTAELSTPLPIRFDRPHVGWAAGVGVEYALSRNWSAKLEYLYADFDGTSRVVGAVPINTDLTMSMVRLGLNYRFGHFGAVAEAPAFPVKAPVYVAAGWTGAYIGAHGGYGWGSFDSSLNGATVASLDPSGGFGGIQSGYNWQLSRNWVIGIEADSSWGSINDSIGAANVDIDAMGTVRGRLGYAMNNVLLYGTGGLAWAHVDSAVAGPIVSDHYFLGWTAGVGVEWAFSPRWTAKLEYAYADFGDATETLGPNVLRDRLDVHTVKFGVNYRASLLGMLFSR